MFAFGVGGQVSLPAMFIFHIDVNTSLFYSLNVWSRSLRCVTCLRLIITCLRFLTIGLSIFGELHGLL